MIPNASDIPLAPFLPCPHCGWHRHHPIDCPNYVVPANGESVAWEMAYSTKLIPEVSADKKSVTMRRRTFMDFFRPIPN